MANEPTVAFRVPELCASAFDEMGAVFGLTRAELFKRLGIMAYFGLPFPEAYEKLAGVADELFPNASPRFWNAAVLVAETQGVVAKRTGERPTIEEALDTLLHWMNEGTEEERAEFKRMLASRMLASVKKPGRPRKATAKKRRRYSRS